jgi:hypothetical protein
MTESAPPTPTRRLVVIATLLLLTLLGVWPFLATLDFPPMGLDSVLWITRGAPDRPGWTQWVFWTQHFKVGYRPVAGLSFTLTHALAGLEPLAYRATDLAIHALNGWLVFAVARRLSPRLPAWSACLAAAVFFLHPGGEEVVAWIERRSYSIATCLSLLGLWAALGAVAGSHARAARRSAGAALACALALLSNEMAVLAIGALPALVFVRAPAAPGRLRATLRVVAPVLATVAVAFAFRLWVVGEVGGYSPRGLEEERVGLVFVAFWRDLFAFCIPYLEHPCELHPAAALALLAGGACCAWISLEPLAQRPIEIPRLVPTVLATWIAGASVVLAMQRVWFPREVYPLLPPLALFIGVAVGETAGRFAGDRRQLLLRLVPLLGLGLVLLWNTPALRGQDPIRLRDWTEMRDMFEDIEQRARGVEEPALVLLAIPYNVDAARLNLLRARPFRAGPPRSTRLTTNWLAARFAGRNVRFLHALSYPEGFEWSSRVRVERSDGGAAALVFPAESEFSVRDQWRHTSEDEAGETFVWLDRFPKQRGRSRYLYVRSGTEGRLLPLADASG